MDSLPVEIVWMFIDYFEYAELKAFGLSCKKYRDICESYADCQKRFLCGLKSPNYRPHIALGTTGDSVIHINNIREATDFINMDMGFANIVIGCDNLNSIRSDSEYFGPRISIDSFSTILQLITEGFDSPCDMRISIVNIFSSGGVGISTMYYSDRSLLFHPCGSSYETTKLWREMIYKAVPDRYHNQECNPIMYNGNIYRGSYMIQIIHEHILSKLSERYSGIFNDVCECIFNKIESIVVKNAMPKFHKSEENDILVLEKSRFKGVISLTSELTRPSNYGTGKFQGRVLKSRRGDIDILIGTFPSYMVSSSKILKEYHFEKEYIEELIDEFVLGFNSMKKRKPKKKKKRKKKKAPFEIDLEKVIRSDRRGPDTYTLKELKVICKKLGIYSSGTKSVLSKAIVRHIDELDY